MTMWTIQEFCNEGNSWGTSVAKLQSRPPAIPINASPSTINQGRTGVTVTITGKSKNGSGFYDPGSGFAKRLRAQISGGVKVTNVDYIGPTKIKLTVSTVGARTGRHSVQIINPDGRKKKTRKLLRVI